MSTPHREDPETRPQAPIDILGRFLALHEAFSNSRSFWTGVLETSNAPRFAAVALASREGEPATLVANVRHRDQELAASLPRRARVAAPVRLLIATMLEKGNDSAVDFVAEYERARKMFRQHRVPRCGVHEVLAILVLRCCHGLVPIPEDAVARMGAIHREIRKRRFWLTGQEYLPKAALLVVAEGAPDQIGAGVDANFSALRAHLWRGQALLSASSVLRLARFDPEEIAARVQDVAAALGRARIMVGPDRYDELVLLCFLSLPAERVVERVVELERALAKLHTAPFWSQRFNLATSLAFLELMQNDPDAVGIADIKAVLDMQELVDQANAAAVS